MIQGFIQDSAVWRKSTSPLVSETNIDQGVGYFNSRIKSFFVDPVCFIDSRTSRLNILATPLEGEMRLWFDRSKIAVDDPVNNLTGDQWEFIMNIVEYVTYATALSIEDLETHLTTNPDTYGTYRPNTLSISASVTADILCSLNNGSTFESEVRRYMTFEYNNGVEIAIIKLWMTSNNFYLEYPLYTILRVVPPCNPTVMINPVMANTIPTIIAAANYDNPFIDTQVTAVDNSGTYTYSTRYVNGSLTGYYNMPFLIFFKGHEPSSLSIRVAIREYLEGIEGIDPTIWPGLFPDLYTDERMYIIPIWDNVTVMLEQDLYPSVTQYNRIRPILQSVFPGLQPDFIDDYANLLTCDSSTVQLIAIPDEGNTTLQDLRTIHPTYTDVDSNNSNFDLQSITTRDFNIKLCNAIATILGSTSTTTTFITITEDGRQYLTFIAGLIEYCVLYRTSFPF